MFEYRDISKIWTCFHFSSSCSRHSWPEEDEGWIGKDRCNFYQLQQQRLSFRDRAGCSFSVYSRWKEVLFFFFFGKWAFLVCVWEWEEEEGDRHLALFLFFHSESLSYSRSSHPCTLTFACEKPIKLPLVAGFKSWFVISSCCCLDKPKWPF